MVRVMVVLVSLGVLGGLLLAGVPQLPPLVAQDGGANGTPWAATPVATPRATLGATPEASPFVVVDIVGRDYDPKGVTIDAGTTVYWVNEDGNAHTATAFEGEFDSGNLSRGAVYAHTFDEPGRYAYGCAYHLDMGGSVAVRQAGRSST